MKRTRLSRVTLSYTLLATVVVFILLNLIANRLLGTHRIDLTENRLYTLSEGTVKTLGKLQEPLTVRLFYSERQANGYPIIQSYAERVKGLLKQYADLSDGKLKLEFVDPEPFSEEEDVAMAQGVRGMPIDTAGNRLFFGLTVSNAVDEVLPIAFLAPDRQAFLEYDITRLIERLGRTANIKIGLLSWLPMRGSAQGYLQGEGPWAIHEQLKEFFELEVLKTDIDKIPDDIDVLMVVHPAGIEDKTAYALDQYILRGGKAVLFLDPHVEIPAIPDKRSDLARLISAWGIRMLPQKVAGDTEAAIRVSASEEVSALGAAPNITWLQLGEGRFSRDEVATADLHMMRMVTAGILERAENAHVTMTPLITTGEQAFLVDETKLMFAEQDPAVLMTDMTPSDRPLVLAARVQGKVESAFRNGQDEHFLAESKEPINVVLVADTDFLRDGFWVQKQNILGQTIYTPTADNGAFVLNLVDYLSGDASLIGLRSRTTEEREFSVVADLRQQAETRFRKEEEQLRSRLTDIEQRMGELQAEEGGGMLISEAQQAQLERFREEMLNTRRELRNVRHALQEEIDALGTRIKLVNIGLMPLLVLFLAWFLPRRLGLKRR